MQNNIATKSTSKASADLRIAASERRVGHGFRSKGLDLEDVVSVLLDNRYIRLNLEECSKSSTSTALQAFSTPCLFRFHRGVLKACQ